MIRQLLERLGLIRRNLDAPVQPPFLREEEEDPVEGTGQSYRRQVHLQKVPESGVIDDRNDSMIRNGNTFVTTEIENRVVTSSGEVVKPNEIRARCSVCHDFESELIRSDYSGLALCHRCMVTVQGSDGRTLKVSCLEAIEVDREFNSWEDFDRRRRSE